MDEAVNKITSATTIHGESTTTDTNIIKASTGYISIFGRTPRLLTLVQELQDLVYEHLFRGEIITIDFNYRIPGILLACKTTYLSAAPVMYKTAIFMAERPLLCTLWLSGMPLKWAQSIREIRLGWVRRRRIESAADPQFILSLLSPLYPNKAAEEFESVEPLVSKDRLAMPISEGHYVRPGVLKARLDDPETFTTTWTT